VSHRSSTVYLDKTENINVMNSEYVAIQRAPANYDFFVIFRLIPILRQVIAIIIID
jgi:hypothetical protein